MSASPSSLRLGNRSAGMIDILREDVEPVDLWVIEYDTVHSTG